MGQDEICLDGGDDNACGIAIFAVFYPFGESLGGASREAPIVSARGLVVQVWRNGAAVAAMYITLGGFTSFGNAEEVVKA